MPQLAIAAAGAAVGGWLAPAGWAFLGMSGAQLGWMAGSMLGSALFPEQLPAQQGPRLDDLKVQTSTYGQPLPILYGTVRMAGNVIWATDIIEHSHTEDVGGKGGGGSQEQTTYTYTVSLAIAICSVKPGEQIIGVRKIWANGRLILNVDDGANAETLLASSQNVPGVAIYSGIDTQLPDPTIEAALGVGNVPAYRGTAYVVLTDFVLSDYGNAIPNFTFEALASGSVNGVKEVTTVDSYTTPLDVVTGYQDGVVTVDDGATMIQVAASGEHISSRPAPSVSIPRANPPGGLALLNYSGDADAPSRLWYGKNFAVDVGWDGLDDKGQYYSTLDAAYIFWPPTTPSAGIVLDDRIILFWWRDASLSNIITLHNRAGGPATLMYDVLAATNTNLKFAWDALYRRLHIWLDVGSVYQVLDEDLNILHTGTWNIPDAAWVQVAVNGDDVVLVTSDASPANRQATWYKLDGSFNPVLQGSGVITTGGVGEVAQPRFVSENLVATGYGFVRISPGVVIAAPTVGNIVSDLCQRAGLAPAEIDVSALTDVCDGYVIARPGTLRSAIEPLQTAYFFDAVESDGKLKFVKRGGAPVATIPIDELIPDADGTTLTLTRARETELPAEVRIAYINRAADYGNGVQAAQRIVTQSLAIVSDQLAIVLSDAQAAQCAAVALYNAWTARTKTPLRLPAKYAGLDPTDIIEIVGEAATYTLRITEATYEAGEIRAAAASDSATVYTVAATAAQGAQGASGQLSLAGPTRMELLDVPLLRDEDDGISLYAALDGALGGWRGGALYKSPDAGSSWAQIGAVTHGAVTGSALTALGNYTGGNTFDEGNRVTLQLNGDDTLASATELQMVSGANAAVLGNEVLQFRDRTVNGDGTVTISGLLRGLAGSEDSMSTHAIGERFVLLSGAAGLLAVGGASDLGLQRSYEAVSFGRSLGSGTRKAIVQACRPLKPLAPVHVGIGKNGGADILIQWTRRGRINTQWRDLADVPLGEAAEAYEIDVFNEAGTGVLRTLQTNTPSATYTFAQQKADFGTVPGTLQARIYQMSGSVGRGMPAIVNQVLPGIRPVLLLHFDGADGAVVFTDELGHTVSVTGNAQIDTAQSRFGGASALFDGVDDRLSIADSADWHFGTGDWTIEFWGRALTKISGSPIIIGQANDLGAGAASWAINTDGTTYVGVNASTGSGTWNIIALASNQYQNFDFSQAAWHHIAISCDYPIVWIFIDGIQYAVGTLAQAMPDSSLQLTIGNGSSDANDLQGWLDELRVIKGTAMYTGGSASSNNGTQYFTPPSGPFTF